MNILGKKVAKSGDNRQIEEGKYIEAKKLYLCDFSHEDICKKAKVEHRRLRNWIEKDKWKEEKDKARLSVKEQYLLTVQDGMREKAQDYFFGTIDRAERLELLADQVIESVNGIDDKNKKAKEIKKVFQTITTLYKTANELKSSVFGISSKLPDKGYIVKQIESAESIIERLKNEAK